MVKRESVANPDIDVDAPRAKRHKDSEAEQAVKDEVDLAEQEPSSDRENDKAPSNADAAPELSPEEVREEGLKVLQVLRDAVNRDGRQLSYDFLRLPSKRQYPDYYDIIKQPIALDDIKTQLENHAYPSLEELRGDLELCFKNARRYNQKDSIIWRDAKTLQKMANKQIDKILNKEDDDGSDKDEGKKKEKGVNIHRLMKNRLQKMVEKTDESGRQLSLAFMDLPSKKKWPLYYKLISRPICIEDIFKRIKRKEYATIPDFMNDVDLIFANAMQFNEEHSLIWEDAKTLQDYFHQIMTALPAKYNMNGVNADSSASPEVSHKIRLKLPGYQTTTHIATADTAPNGEASTTTVRLRVPAFSGSTVGSSGGTSAGDSKQTNVSPAKGKTTSPTAPDVSLPSSVSIPHTSHASTSTSTANQLPPSTSSPSPALAMPTPKPAKVATPTPVKPTPSVQPTSQQQPSPYTPFHQYTTPNHIPSQGFYAPTASVPSQTPGHASATPAPSSSTPVAPTGRTDAPSPVPPASAAGLYSVRIESCPPGSNNARRRIAILDKQIGVRNFAVRIPRTESELIIRNVKFTTNDGDGEEGTDAEEEPKVVQTPVKKRGRGRPRKVIPIDQEVHAPPIAPPESSNESTATTKEKSEWHVPATSEVLVRLDGQDVSPRLNESSKAPPVLVNGNGGLSTSTSAENGIKPEDEWAVDVTPGQHILEIGRKGSTVHWRVYLSVT